MGESGKVYSFEFHEPRFEQAQYVKFVTYAVRQLTLSFCRKEFSSHGLSNVIELRHRNVCKDGFTPVSDVDAGKPCEVLP